MKYMFFAVLMVAAIMFSVQGNVCLGTGFLLIAAVYAVLFLHKDGNDDDGIYGLT